MVTSSQQLVVTRLESKFSPTSLLVVLQASWKLFLVNFINFKRKLGAAHGRGYKKALKPVTHNNYETWHSYTFPKEDPKNI